MNHLRPALVLTLLLILVTGVAFPWLVYGIAQVAFPQQANGSLVREGGRVVGSDLVGQPFASDRYFHSRRVRTEESGYGKTSPTLGEFEGDYRLRQGLPSGERLPADAATHSASGLDPHISPANAALQASRVARARGLSVERVRELVARHTEGRFAGVLGEPRVNVLRLNLALDAEGGRIGTSGFQGTGEPSNEGR